MQATQLDVEGREVPATTVGPPAPAHTNTVAVVRGFHTCSRKGRPA